ncbi:MAG: porin [Gemmatimonadota bacterium]
MSRLTAGLFSGLIVLTAPSVAAAQAIEEGRVRVDVTGYAQIQWNTTSVDEEDLDPNGVLDPSIAWSTFETRRIRPTVRVVIDDWIEGKIQPDFALGEIQLADAFIDFAIGEAFGIRFGQFKKPFSRIELTSSSRIIAIERGLRIRGLVDAFLFDLANEPDPPFVDIDGGLLLGDEYTLLDALGYLGRDMGVAVHGGSGRLGYALGVFNGSGADRRDDSDGKSVAGRVEYSPRDDWPLVIAAAGSYRELLFDGELLGVGVRDEIDGFALEADVEWGEFRRPGAHVLVEGVIGENFVAGLTPGPAPGPADATLLGLQAVLAWFEPYPAAGGRIEGVEPLLRASYGDPSLDRDGDGGWLLTPGANLYFFGGNRVMLNWDVFLAGGEAVETEHALRVQTQLSY